jgi:putative transposase
MGPLVLFRPSPVRHFFVVHPLVDGEIRLEAMTRERRRARSRHVPGGVYYVVRRGGHTGRPIFVDALDYATFERLLALAVARYRCRLHGFYWEPDAVHLAIQVSDRPVGRFLQWLCGWYSRSVSNGRAKESLFEQNYRAMLIEPGQTLLRLIRYLHLGPVDAGTAADPADSALSSHRAYLGIVHIPWLTTSVALRLLAPSLEGGRVEYRRWMMQGTMPSEGKLAVLSQQMEKNSATVAAGVDRHRGLHPELLELPSLRARSVESLQIRAVPVPRGKDSRL